MRPSQVVELANGLLSATFEPQDVTSLHFELWALASPVTPEPTLQKYGTLQVPHTHTMEGICFDDRFKYGKIGNILLRFSYMGHDIAIELGRQSDLIK